MSKTRFGWQVVNVKRYDVVLFDLDGTLSESGEGITNSVAYALKKFGVEAAERSELYRFIGPPLVDSFQKYYGFSREEAARATAYYREYYREKGIFENRPYDGIEEVLKKLREAGKTLVVATSKPEVFARRILEHFGLSGYFAYIAGASLDETRIRKGEVIRYALEACAVTEKEKAVMVGDREHDVIGARENGLDCIGVLFGYGSREELEQAGALCLAERVEDIARLLLGPDR